MKCTPGVSSLLFVATPLLLLLLLPSFSQAQQPSGSPRGGWSDDDDDFERDFGDFEVEYGKTGPLWNFELDHSNDEYILRFTALFELESNLQQVAASTVSASLLKWNVTANTDSVSLFTTTSAGGLGSLTFNLPLDISQTAFASNIQVAINNYHFISSSDSAQLVLAFELVTNSRRQLQDYVFGTPDYPHTLFLDNVYLNFSSPTTTGLTVNPVLAGSSLWVVLPRFSGSTTVNGRFGFWNTTEYVADDDDGDHGGGHHGWIAAVVILPVVAVVGLGAFLWWKKPWKASDRPREDFLRV